MKHLNLAEMNLSQIILGTDGYSERIDKSTAFKIMECYTENGGNVIDTARLYCDGMSEKCVGEFIKGIRDSIYISTKWVYTTLKWDTLTKHPDIDGMIDALNKGSITGVSNTLENVLETVTIPAHPVIQDIKDKMIELGAINAMMSGSGPTVFGLFPDEEKGEQAYEICKNLYPAYQVEWSEFVSRKQIKEA